MIRQNREIKFRAWDGDKMIYDIPLYGSHLGINDFIFGSALTIMQFTGLKDKNGKEIFEGDILESPMSDLVAENEKFIVEYVNGFYSRFRQYDESIIIGNIYENINLINKTNKIKKS